MTDPGFCREAVERTVRELGRLDILVNNAAYQEHLPSLEDITDEQLDRTFRTNIYGYFYMARAALKHLKAGRGDHQQRIGHRDRGEQGAARLLGHQGGDPRLHQVAGAEPGGAGHPGERVAPGPVWTPLNPADQDRDKVAEFGTDVPMERPAQPEEVAPAYVFLAAPACSSYITGEILPVLGGVTVA